MRISLRLKVILACALLAALIMFPRVGTEAGTVWLVIGDPVPAPRSGEEFTTPLQFTTWDAVLGAYLITLFYDPNVLQIVSITTPSQSEFNNTTFVDEGSFTTGATTLAAFQTTNTSAQSDPETFATVQWKALGSSGTSTTIMMDVENMLDAQTRAVEVNTASLTATIGSSTPIPPASPPGSRGGSGGCALNPHARFDPTLIGIVGLILVSLSWKRIRRQRRS
jgi:hypothetical protein